MSSNSKSITPAAPPRSSRAINKRSPAERERLLARFARSGQTQVSFCRENDLPLSTLTFWLRQARRRLPQPIEGQLVQIPPRAVAAVYMPEAGVPAPGTVQIRVPSQIELAVGAGADPAWVGALLRGVLTCSG